MAARTTRRSFLGRLAQFAVIVAGGPSLVALLARRAEARVCGQSGVSPKCPTFDCTFPDSVWGWCWYASPGCCTANGLKKICDCCTRAWPNVHGYCPAGTNVRCIVESCHADPRVMTAPMIRIGRSDAITTAAAVAENRFAPLQVSTAVVGDAEDHAATALAASAAGSIGGPLVLTRQDELSAGAVGALQRLGVEKVIVVGPALEASIERELASYSLAVERLGAHGAALEAVSVDVARWIMARTGRRVAFAVDRTGVSGSIAPAVGAGAGAVKAPLVIGIDAARALATGEGTRSSATYLVGPSLAERAGEVPGARPLTNGDMVGLARTLATAVVDTEGASGISAGFTPLGEPGTAAGLGGCGGVLLYHPPGGVDGDTIEWVRARQVRFVRGISAGGSGRLGDPSVYQLQSALNHYDTHRLIGVSGQGLPVISQPLAEREIGRARIAGAASEDMGGYWTSRANPDR
jgi:hypothetical protein